MSGVNNVTNSQAAAVQSQNAAQNNAAQTTVSNAEEEKVVVAQDEYAGSVPNVATGNYNKNGYKADMDKVNELKADLKNNIGAFKAMLEGMENNKGANRNDPDYWSAWVQEQLGGQYSVQQAQEAVSDDGYWGVEKTSQRIVDFAKAISGGDIEQYDKLLDAIEKGFGAAKDEWGGKMPDITSKTYDAVMEKMKAWKEETIGQNTVTEDAVNAAQGAALN